MRGCTRARDGRQQGYCKRQSRCTNNATRVYSVPADMHAHARARGWGVLPVSGSEGGLALDLECLREEAPRPQQEHGAHTCCTLFTEVKMRRRKGVWGG